MECTTYNFDRYLGRLGIILTNDHLIDKPKTTGEILVIRRGKYGKRYWDVDRRRVTLRAGAATVDIRECGEVNREGRFRVIEHSYHFRPRIPEFYEYRIDLEKSGELHANCDLAETVELVRQRASDLGVKKIVVFTTDGEGPRELHRALKGAPITIIAVTWPYKQRVFNQDTGEPFFLRAVPAL